VHEFRNIVGVARFLLVRAGSKDRDSFVGFVPLTGLSASARAAHSFDETFAGIRSRRHGLEEFPVE
jgi:hypothetical protein